MYELATWINQNFERILTTPLYKKHFFNYKPKKLEDTDIFYLENLNSGIDVLFDRNLRVSSIHLFSGKFMNGKIFTDPLPFGITFNFGNKALNKLLGEPNVYGGGFDDKLLGYIEYWEKYYFKSYSLHLKYSKNKNNILLITLGSLTFEKESLSN